MDLTNIAMAKAIGGSGVRVINFVDVDSVYIGEGFTPADFYDTIIVYTQDGDWVRVTSTATNANTITFRSTEQFFYFYYQFSDGCVYRHNS